MHLTSDDTEAIAAQKPDLIIAFSTDSNLAQLKAIAPVLVIDYGKNNYLEMMTALGKVFDKEDKAKEWLNQWEENQGYQGRIEPIHRPIKHLYHHGFL